MSGSNLIASLKLSHDNDDFIAIHLVETFHHLYWVYHLGNISALNLVSFHLVEIDSISVTFELLGHHSEIQRFTNAIWISQLIIHKIL